MVLKQAVIHGNLGDTQMKKGEEVKAGDAIDKKERDKKGKNLCIFRHSTTAM